MTSGKNPYVGPIPLPRGRRIFGREYEIAELADIILSERTSLLYSPSGAGKSSLINAGLIPRLENMGFYIYPIVRLNRPVPDELAASSINRYLWSTIWNLSSDDVDIGETVEQVPKLSLSMALNEHKEGDERRRRLLIIDQAEELFTIDPLDRKAKKAFLAAIRKELDDPYLFVLFAMREEYVTLLEEMAPYLSISGHFRLDFLALDAAEEAIKLPARAHGVEFGDELASELARNLSLSKADVIGAAMVEIHGQVEPVQIQLVCRRMWAFRDHTSDSITKADFPDDAKLSGAVDSALADYYSETVRDVADKTDAQEVVIRRWISSRLITRNGLRNQASLGQAHDQNITDDTLQELESSHLIRSERRGNRSFYELAHDRLVGPILAEEKNWRQLHLPEFQIKAEKWAEAGDKSALLTPKEYRRARRWQAKHNYELEPNERRFMKSSRDRNRLRVLSWGMGLIVIFALAPFQLFQQRLEIQEQQLEIAEQNNKENSFLLAQEQLQKEINAKERARMELEMTIARSGEESMRAIAESRFVQAKLTEASLFAQMDNYRSAKEALEQFHISRVPAEQRIAAAILKWHVDSVGLRSGVEITYNDTIGGSLTSAALSRDGAWLFVSGKYGGAYLVNRETDQYKPIVEGTATEWTKDPVFLSDGARLLARTSDGKFMLWRFALEGDALSYELVNEFQIGEGEVLSSSLSPGERSLLVVSKSPCPATPSLDCFVLQVASPRGSDARTVYVSDERIHVVKAVSDEYAIIGGENVLLAINYINPDDAPKEFDDWVGTVESLALRDDGMELSFGTAEGTVSFVQLNEATDFGERRLVSIGDAPVRSISYFDQATVIVGGDDQIVRVIDTQSGSRLRVFQDHESSVSVVLTNNESEVISVGLDGHVYNWVPNLDRAHSVVDLDDRVDEYCRRKECATAYPSHAAASVALSPDLETVAVGFQHGGFATYSIRRNRISLYKPWTGSGRNSIRRLEIDHDGRYLAAAEKQARVYALGNGEEIAAADKFALGVSSVSFLESTERPTLLASSWDGRIALLPVPGDATYFPSSPVNTWGDRNYDKELNSAALDCSGTRVVTTTNLRSTIWNLENGQPERMEHTFNRSPHKTVWASLWNRNSMLLEAGFVGTRRLHTKVDIPTSARQLNGHFADVNKAIFGPYGKTILSLDTNGRLKIRSISDSRDLLSIELPSRSGSSPIERTRDFALRCTHDEATGHIKRCALAAPLGTRAGIVVMDLGDALATDRLFEEELTADPDTQIETCESLSRM